MSLFPPLHTSFETLKKEQQDAPIKQERDRFKYKPGEYLLALNPSDKRIEAWKIISVSVAETKKKTIKTIKYLSFPINSAHDIITAIPPRDDERTFISGVNNNMTVLTGCRSLRKDGKFKIWDNDIPNIHDHIRNLKQLHDSFLPDCKFIACTHRHRTVLGTLSTNIL
jgi:hypothetical protein